MRRAGPRAAAGAAGGGAAGARRPGLAAAAPQALADRLVPAPREGGRGARVPGFSKQGKESDKSCLLSAFLSPWLRDSVISVHLKNVIIYSLYILMRIFNVGFVDLIGRRAVLQADW